MATVHPSRLGMVPRSQPPPPPPRRSPTPPPRSREEELKLKLLAKRKQQHSESSGLKIKGSSRQDNEEHLQDIYRERERGSAEPGPSRDRSSGMHGWDDRDGDNYRRRSESRSRSRHDDRYARQRSGSRPREDDIYRPRRSDSRDRPPRHDDRYRPRSRSRSRERRPRDDREHGRNDRQPPPHLPPFPPKWDQNLPPPIAPPIRLGFGGPGPADLIPGQGQGQGQGYQPGPGPRGHGGNGFRQGGAIDFEKSVLSSYWEYGLLMIDDDWRGRIIHYRSGHPPLKAHIGMKSKLLLSPSSRGQANP